MKRALAAVLLILGAIVVPAGTATAAGCSSRSSSKVSGGYEVTLWCSRGGYIDGLGTVLTDAARNARLAASIS